MSRFRAQADSTIRIVIKHWGQLAQRLTFLNKALGQGVKCGQHLLFREQGTKER